MLAAARTRLPTARFARADAETWLPEPGTDVVFANAVYQWVAGHLELFPWIVESLEPGGVLALQMPDNLMQPMHVLMREVAARVPFAQKLEGAARAPLPPVGAYYDALAGSARRLDIWHTIYNHVLPEAGAVVEWVKGTGLGPFLQRLDDDERAFFLDAYAEAIAQAYPPAADGKVLMSFARLFIIAER
jgi:trans-aconitate 2-methyltransferase